MHCMERCFLLWFMVRKLESHSPVQQWCFQLLCNRKPWPTSLNNKGWTVLYSGKFGRVGALGGCISILSTTSRTQGFAVSAILPSASPHVGEMAAGVPCITTISRGRKKELPLILWIFYDQKRDLSQNSPRTARPHSISLWHKLK